MCVAMPAFGKLLCQRAVSVQEHTEPCQTKLSLACPTGHPSRASAVGPRGAAWIGGSHDTIKDSALEQLPAQERILFTAIVLSAKHVASKTST